MIMFYIKCINSYMCWEIYIIVLKKFKIYFINIISIFIYIIYLVIK